MVVFITTIGLFMWVFPGDFNVFDAGYANIDTLFIVAPWVFMFLAPAITMKSFSDELKTGTIELLLTKPLSDWQIILGKYFAGATLGDCKVPTMVTSYDIQNRRTVFLKSWYADHQLVRCCDAARATSAAPTYFEPKPLDTGDVASVLIDGGIFMNSPSVSAYAEARKLFPDEPIAVLSLGTGELTRPIAFGEARTWGSALWVMSLLDCMFDGVSKAADHQMQLFLGERYQRLQTSLESASDDMDDASEENIRNLKRTARELINANEAVLEQFFEIDAGNAQP